MCFLICFRSQSSIHCSFLVSASVYLFQQNQRTLYIEGWSGFIVHLKRDFLSLSKEIFDLCKYVLGRLARLRNIPDFAPGIATLLRKSEYRQQVICELTIHQAHRFILYLYIRLVSSIARASIIILLNSKH